jgi:very-short-patch-repair endonuclease
MAAVLAARPATASYLSAGWLWGLLRTQPETIHVSTPTARRSRPDLVVHFAALPALDMTVIDEISVTALPRTLLDLASVLTPRRLEGVLERAEEIRAFDLVPVTELLGRVGHHPGAATLRRALGAYGDEPAVLRSQLERRFLRLVKTAGLSTPSMNFNVGGYELDAYWEAEHFAVEIDAYSTHGSRAAFERDRIRQEDLKLIGVEMTRVTGQRLDREPVAVMERIAELLAQRRGERASPRL